ncbi:ABC transporter substrate-binding protein [Streptomyces sp. NPDC005438]|uniref:ABC transporter substrate-binding protein n=1 Tax=Streptomyces sp. NPDC005438 TaxID=3156880 RepID=UPI0033AB36AE
MALVGAALLTVSAVTACGGDGGSADGNTTIRIAHNSNAGVLSARVAEAQGYFEDHGLTVKFTKVENVETLPPALGKSFDIVLSTPTLLLSSSARGLDVVEAAGTSVEVKDNPTAAVIGSGKTGVKSAKDLGGKTVGVLNETGTLHLATQYWLEKNGVSPDSVKVAQVNPPAGKDQLKAGRVDAVETVTPFIDSILADKDSVLLTHPHLEMAPEIGLILWATSGSWADQNPKALAGFRKALADAVKWIEDSSNEDEAREVLGDYTGLPADVVGSLKLPKYAAEPRPQDHKVWLKAMRDYADFKGKVDLDKLVAGDSDG